MKFTLTLCAFVALFAVFVPTPTVAPDETVAVELAGLSLETPTLAGLDVTKLVMVESAVGLCPVFDDPDHEFGAVLVDEWACCYGLANHCLYINGHHHHCPWNDCPDGG